MKYSLILVVITLAFSAFACTTGKVNYRVNDQGQLVVEKTAEGEVAIRGGAADASSEAAEFEKNMTIKVMYSQYLKLLGEGKFEDAKKVRIEIEVLKGKIPSTPDTPVLTPPENKKDTNEVSTLSSKDPSYWKKRKEEIMNAKKAGRKPPVIRQRFKND